MASEVWAASNRANSWSPAMRDSIYAVESPWVVQYVRWISIALTSNFWTTGILLICQCHGQQNSLKAASKRGHWLHKIARNCSKSAAFLLKFEWILYILDTLMDDTTSEDVHRSFHDVLGGQNNLKTKKMYRKWAKSRSQYIFVTYILCSWFKLLKVSNFSIKQPWSNGNHVGLLIQLTRIRILALPKLFFNWGWIISLWYVKLMRLEFINRVS